MPIGGPNSTPIDSMIGTMKFEARIRELVERLPDLAVLVEPLLIVRRVIREQLGILHRRWTMTCAGAS